MHIHRFPPLSILYTINRSFRPSVCRHCLTARQISTSPLLLKKGGGKQEQKRTVGINADKTSALGKDDALNFSDFQHAIDKATSHLKTQLSKLRTGGVDLEAIESLNVDLSAPSGGGGQGPKKDGSRSGKKSEENIVRLGDIAQVVPKGRTVVVIVGEKDVTSLNLFLSRCLPILWLDWIYNLHLH